MFCTLLFSVTLKHLCCNCKTPTKQYSDAAIDMKWCVMCGLRNMWKGSVCELIQCKVDEQNFMKRKSEGQRQSLVRKIFQNLTNKSSNSSKLFQLLSIISLYCSINLFLHDFYFYLFMVICNTKQHS